jgi:hypothetical protein
MAENNYGSHIKLFEAIFGTVNINNVLEFGMGDFSTGFFTDRCGFVVSVEQESMDWYNRLIGKISSNNWKGHFEEDPKVIFEEYSKQGISFDLVFSDGKADTRRQVAELAFDRKIPIVVLHDAEKVWYYHWNLLDIPGEYMRFDFRCMDNELKVTTVLTNRYYQEFRALEVPQHERIFQAYSSPRQPIIQIDFNGNIRLVTLNSVYQEM